MVLNKKKSQMKVKNEKKLFSFGMSTEVVWPCNKDGRRKECKANFLNASDRKIWTWQSPYFLRG